MAPPPAPAVERTSLLLLHVTGRRTGTVYSTTMAQAYQRLIDEVGVANAARRLGIRVNVDRAPTRDELVDAVRREHLSVVRLRTGDPE